MKKLLLKSMLLLCALIVGGVNSAWATVKTSTLTFTAKCNGSGTATGGITWTVTSDGTESTFDSNSGIHYGTNSANVQYVTLTSAAFNNTYTITKVVVNARDAQANAAITVKVGTTSFNTGTPASTSASATNTSTDYEFTGSAAGAAIEVKVNRTASMNKAIYVKSIVVTYDDGSSLITPTISFDNASYSTTLGQSFTPPTPNCNSDGAKTYSSSNTEVAEVVNASTGTLNIKKAGNATITLNVAESSTYASGSASYELIVRGPIVDGVYDFAINQDYGSGAVPGTNSNNTTETTWTAGNVTMDVAGRNIWYNGNDLRLYKTSTSPAAAAGNITISVTGDRYITRIDLTGGGNLNLTSGGGKKNGTIWSGKSQSVKFTHNEGGTITLTKITVTYCSESEFNAKVNITMGADGYMTYCYQDAALSFGTLEAFVASAVGNDNVTLTPITKAPAGTAVVLKGAAGSYDLTKEETPDDVTSNRLRVSNGNITSNSNYDVYALAKKSTDVGFYLVQAGVNVPVGKCYISVNKNTAREYLGFAFDDEATGLNDVKIQKTVENGEYYNLAGQRVANPTKGLYIVNGKKVIIK